MSEGGCKWTDWTKLIQRTLWGGGACGWGKGGGVGGWLVKIERIEFAFTWKKEKEKSKQEPKTEKTKEYLYG